MSVLITVCRLHHKTMISGSDTAFYEWRYEEMGYVFKLKEESV